MILVLKYLSIENRQLPLVFIPPLSIVYHYSSYRSYILYLYEPTLFAYLSWRRECLRLHAILVLLRLHLDHPDQSTDGGEDGGCGGYDVGEGGDDGGGGVVVCEV